MILYIQGVIWLLFLLSTQVEAFPIIHNHASFSVNKERSRSILYASRSWFQQHQEIRGNRYGSANNSTILTPEEAATYVGVKPTAKAPRFQWQWAWRTHRRLLPLLHFGDACSPPDSSRALICIWLKALAGMDQTSPVFDNKLTYDLLPRLSRLILRLPTMFFPRLHHANVEIRTAFLNQSVKKMIAEFNTKYPTRENRRIKLITLGAGYDVRSVRFLEEGLVDEALEFDLPQVVESKGKMLEQRLFPRRTKHTSRRPSLHEIDLNDTDQIPFVLKSKAIDPGETLPTLYVLVLEGVLIYLDDPSAVLKALGDTFKGQDAVLCFADRLANVPGGDMQLANKELGECGWKLNEWLPKPGLARHMGSVWLRRSS